MNHSRAIEVNLAALRNVVEEIFALLELVFDGTVKHLPRIFHQAAVRLLCPAEAALRRLIVLAAIGIAPKPLRHRPFLKGKKIVATGTGPLSFQLFDMRKNFNQTSRSKTNKTISPRIHFFDAAPLVSHLIPQSKKPKTSNHLIRRFVAFKRALDNFPHQAKRLIQWQMKRAELKETKFRFPLRPGPPPGLRRNSDHEIDRILRECHRLAIAPRPAAPS